MQCKELLNPGNEREENNEKQKFKSAKRLYITVGKVFKEYVPNDDEPYKTLYWKLDYNNLDSYYDLSPKKIFCGDGTTLINTRVLPIGLWITLFLLPFILLTLLSNISDIGFLTRHPEILMFGNISHFQITPASISEVKIYQMSSFWTTLNLVLSLLGMATASYATFDTDLSSFSGDSVYGSSYLIGTTLSMVPMVGLGGSLRFVCMSCCFPWKPAYNEETNSLHYMKDNQLLDIDDPCLTMTIRSRGVEMTATLPPL